MPQVVSHTHNNASQLLTTTISKATMMEQITCITSANFCVILEDSHLLIDRTKTTESERNFVRTVQILDRSSIISFHWENNQHLINLRLPCRLWRVSTFWETVRGGRDGREADERGNVSLFHCLMTAPRHLRKKQKWVIFSTIYFNIMLKMALIAYDSSSRTL
jgi:hypothetical protein